MSWDTQYMTSVDKAFAEEMQQSFENQRRVSEAALDMLEALEEVRDYLTQGLPADGKGHQADMWRKVHRAIVKARGAE